MHPQKVCRWHQAEYCGWYSRGKGWHPEGPWQTGEVGPCESHEGQQHQVQDLALGSRQLPVSVQTGWWKDWEQPCRGLGDIGRWKTGHNLAMCTCSPMSWQWVLPTQKASCTLGCIKRSMASRLRKVFSWKKFCLFIQKVNSRCFSVEGSFLLNS